MPSALGPALGVWVYVHIKQIPSTHMLQLIHVHLALLSENITEICDHNLENLPFQHKHKF